MELYILSVDIFIDHEYTDTEIVGVFDTLDAVKAAKSRYQTLRGKQVDFNPVEVVNLNKIVLPEKHRVLDI